MVPKYCYVSVHNIPAERKAHTPLPLIAELRADVQCGFQIYDHLWTVVNFPDERKPEWIYGKSNVSTVGHLQSSELVLLAGWKQHRRELQGERYSLHRYATLESSVISNSTCLQKCWLMPGGSTIHVQ